MYHLCTTIDGKYPDRSATDDGIEYTTGLISAIGFAGAKLELSNAYFEKYPYESWGGSPATLEELVQTTPFADVLADPALTRLQFNTFSLAVGENNPWAYSWTDAKGDALEQEFYDLAAHIRATYPNKHVVLQCWEGDWQLLNAFDPNAGVPLTRLNAYRDYNRRRQRALAQARTDNPGGTGSIRYGIECNRVLDDWSFRVHRDILDNVRPDVVPLSIYETIEGWTAAGGAISTQGGLEADIDAKIRRVLTRVRENVPSGTPIIFGEYGFPQLAPYFTPFGFDIGALHQRVIDTGDALGVEGEIFWQATDNEEYAADQPIGFCLYERNGSSTTVGALTESGQFYQNLLP